MTRTWHSHPNCSEFGGPGEDSQNLALSAKVYGEAITAKEANAKNIFYFATCPDWVNGGKRLRNSNGTQVFPNAYMPAELKNLQPGAKLWFRYNGKEAMGVFLDVGPASWTKRYLDLGYPLARYLGFKGTGTVEWALDAPEPVAPPKPPTTGGNVGVYGYHTHVKLKEALFVWNATAGTKRNGGKKWAEGAIVRVTGPIKVINGKKYIQAKHGDVEGWIYYGSVRFIEPSAGVAQVKPKTKADKFIDYVEAAWYDNPNRRWDYLWGAEGPSKWDCSGLFHAALTYAGVKDTRTTAHEYHNMMHAISAPSQVGDVAFHHDSSGHVTHIVIYTDDGYFIEARGKDFGIERHAVSTAAGRGLKWFRSDKINAALKAAA